MIDMNKKYRYRSGGSARVLCTDRKNLDYPVVSMSENGILRYHDKYGKVHIKDPKGVMIDEFDLIEARPYDNLRKGDVIEFSTGGRRVLSYWGGLDEDGNPQFCNDSGVCYTICFGDSIRLICRKENIEG